MSRLLGVARQEDEPGAVLAGRRQGDAEPGALAAQEPVRHLEQDAGAVAGVRLAAAGAAVQEVDQDLERLAHDRVRAPPLDVHDEADAAGVVLVARVVETLGGRLAWHQPLRRAVIPLICVNPSCEDSCTILLGTHSISHYGKFDSPVSEPLMM